MYVSVPGGALTAKRQDLEAVSVFAESGNPQFRNMEGLAPVRPGNPAVCPMTGKTIQSARLGAIKTAQAARSGGDGVAAKHNQTDSG